MSKEQDGGPAFPTRKERYIAQELTVDYLPGMSLRDWFAGQALAGLMANSHPQALSLNAEEKTTVAFGQADAMLAERHGK